MELLGLHVGRFPWIIAVWY